VIDLRRAIRRTSQAVLCASALAGGAAAAYGVQSPRHASADIGVFPRPMPAAIRAPLERTARPTAPTFDPTPEPLLEESTEPVRLGPEPVGPFAGRLRDGMVMTGRTPHRLILFTFDDGPDPRNTPRLLDHLDDAGIKAVFFLTASRMNGVGPWVRENQAIAQEIVRRGHIVGNHTLDHASLPMLDNAGIAAQVRGAEEVFERVLGERTWLLRPPGGARSPRVDAQLAAQGYTQVMWNLGTGDFQVRSDADVVRTFQRVLERREREDGDRGGIILMHDTHAWSVDAFPQLVSWLRERNCELLERGEELYDVVDDPSFFFVPRGEAQASAEAPPAAPDPAVLEARQARLRLSTRERCQRLAQR
jgi:peptidoglycan/xylan/chitin deacetylase (PgdA/CDA1 family)